MNDEMTLNTRIVHSLLDLSIGGTLAHANITVEKDHDGDVFNVWEDDDRHVFDDINVAADFIEENLEGDDWPIVEPKMPTCSFEVTITQFRDTLEDKPSEDQVQRAVHQGLILLGFSDLESVTVTNTEKE